MEEAQSVKKFKNISNKQKYFHKFNINDRFYSFYNFAILVGNRSECII